MFLSKSHAIVGNSIARTSRSFLPKSNKRWNLVMPFKFHPLCFRGMCASLHSVRQSVEHSLKALLVCSHGLQSPPATYSKSTSAPACSYASFGKVR
jgi:hypothetical protein